ncbi:MAG: peroxiredoxin [Methylacidiphilales bacterium]|nr:peroxiredoxin [Candidatus Methylacidiphilales bacterium]MDW8349356.1 peroxiredoxin [Verrucomicrobiae bacterium]
MKTKDPIALQPGSRAPDFSALDQHGKLHTLHSLLATKRPLVLYFYPKDHTPGCTRQACAFRDLYSSFAAIPVTLCGISPDSTASHARFAEKYQLPFTLLSDENKTIAQAYGTYVQKKLYGKVHMGIERTTFVISPDGSIRYIFRRVSPDSHPQEILETLRQA